VVHAKKLETAKILQFPKLGIFVVSSFFGRSFSRSYSTIGLKQVPQLSDKTDPFSDPLSRLRKIYL
jgi:hypothetical protein